MSTGDMEVMQEMYGDVPCNTLLPPPIQSSVTHWDSFGSKRPHHVLVISCLHLLCTFLRAAEKENH